MVDIVYTYNDMVSNSRILSWFGWYDKYTNMPDDYIPLNKYKEFYKLCDDFIEEIKVLLSDIRYYRISSEYLLQLQNNEMLYDYYSKYNEHINNVGPVVSWYILQTMVQIARKYRLPILTVFIMAF